MHHWNETKQIEFQAFPIPILILPRGGGTEIRGGTMFGTQKVMVMENSMVEGVENVQ